MYIKLVLVFMTFFFVACSNEDEAKKEDCNGIACTMNFVTINVNIKDASGVNVSLDSYEVIDIDSGKNLTIVYKDEEYQYFKEQGLYPIFSDAYRLHYQNDSTTISFKGYVSANEVVNGEFVVGADCCHVSLISGNTDIILD